MKRLELGIRLAEFQMDADWSGLSPSKSAGGEEQGGLHHGDITDNVLQVSREIRMKYHKGPLLTFYNGICERKRGQEQITARLVMAFKSATCLPLNHISLKPSGYYMYRQI
jgi:hypothetical protein